jgi:hypothetical protein
MGFVSEREVIANDSCFKAKGDHRSSPADRPRTICLESIKVWLWRVLSRGFLTLVASTHGAPLSVPKTNSLLVNNAAPIDRSTRGTTTGLYQGAKTEKPVFPGFFAFLSARVSGIFEESFARGAFVKVLTLATKRLNARRREIDRRAFFVFAQSFAGFLRFSRFAGPNRRDLCLQRVPSLERNLQGCVRQCEKSVPNSLTLSFRGPPVLTQSSRSESG